MFKKRPWYPKGYVPKEAREANKKAIKKYKKDGGKITKCKSQFASEEKKCGGL